MKITALSCILAISAISGVQAKKKGGDKYKYGDRNLKEVSTASLTEQHNACMGVDYNMHLVIDGFHFAGVATPVGSDECPNVLFHSGTNEDDVMSKYSLIATPEDLAAFDAESKLFLGKKPLKSIMSAYDAAPVGKDGSKFYDSITNNCVSLLRNMADPLDVDINDEMIGFVSKKLLSHNENSLWEGINKSTSLSLLVDGGNRMLKGLNKEDMLAKLIKLYV